MPTIAISVPSGAHHRSFLQPMRDAFVAETDWQFLVLSPGAPWADALLPADFYPPDRFRFIENSAAESGLRDTRPELVITTTTGLDPQDVPLLEAAKKLGLRTATFVESWDNVWKMERIANGRGKPGQRIVLPDFLLVWNDTMKQHALRAFPELGQSPAGSVPSPGGPGARSGQGSVPLDRERQAFGSERSSLGIANGRSVGWAKPKAGNSARVFVTGAPRLDYFGPKYADQLPPRAETLRSFGLSPEGRVLHLATTELYDHSHVAKAIGDAKRRGELPPDLQLYASVHPGGNLERHRPWAEQHGFVMRFSPGRHEPAPHPDFRYNPTREEILTLVALFKETDVAVNLSSTVALESCMADRPVICAFFGKPFDWLTWRRSMVVRDFKEHYADLLRGGGITVARNPRALVREIREYLADPEKDRAGRRRSAELIATTPAGEACLRVLAVLKSLIA